MAGRSAQPPRNLMHLHEIRWDLQGMDLKASEDPGSTVWPGKDIAAAAANAAARLHIPNRSP